MYLIVKRIINRSNCDPSPAFFERVCLRHGWPKLEAKLPGGSGDWSMLTRR